MKSREDSKDTNFFRLQGYLPLLAFFILLISGACSISPDSHTSNGMLDGLPAAAYDRSSLQTADQQYKHVLLLNSYNPEHEWTNEITDGVKSVLNMADTHVDLHTEYMDIKSFDDPDYLEHLFRLYKMKFKSARFDAVIAVNDDAFQFVLKYRQRLFPDIPIIFCGVSYFDDKMLTGQGNITGLHHIHDHLKNLNLILRIHPDIHHLALISDSTTTGIIQRRQLENTIHKIDRVVDVIFLSDLDMEKLKVQVADLPADSAIFMTGFNRDRAGVIFNSTESLYQITNAAQVPIYSNKYAYLGYGIVGGYIDWGFPHGESAAKMVLSVLQGTPADSIAVKDVLSSSPMFDYRQLQRFNINTSILPEDRIIAYSPDPAAKRNNLIIFGLLVFLFIESLMILLLVWNRRMRQKAEQSLRDSEERYRQLVEHFPGGMVMLFDHDLHCSMLGGSSLSEIGLTKASAEGSSIFDIFPEETCQALEPHFRLSLQGTASIFEFQQFVHVYEAHTLPLRDQNGNIIAGMAVVQNITRRKQADLELHILTHELEQNEERLNLAIMGAELGLWDWDIQSGGMVYNRRWAEMLGYALEEIEPHIGFWEQIVHPDDMPRIMHAFAEHFVGKNVSYDNEIRIRAKSGEWKWILARGKVVQRDENGIPLRATGTHLDITERKHVEEALRENKQRLDLAIMGADLGLWDWNLENNEIIFSEGWLQMMGYTQDEIGRSFHSWKKLIHPDDINAVISNADAHIQGLVSTFEAEYRVHNKGGEWKWFLSRGRIVEFSATGTPLRLSGTLLDITRRKLAQVEQRQVEERLDMALNAANLGLWDINLQSGRGICDQRFVDMLGYTLEEIDFLGKEWGNNYVHPDDIDASSEKYKAHINGLTPSLEIEQRLRTQTGEWKWIQTRGRVVEWDDNGKASRIVGTNMDITQRKRAEEALHSRMLALTEPYGNVSDFNFSDVFNIEEIQAIQDAFAGATGVASIINDLNGQPITRGSNSRRACRMINHTPAGLENCMKTAALLARPRAGNIQFIDCIGASFMNCCARISLGDDHIANWIIGEVLCEDYDRDALFAYAQQLGIDEQQFKQAVAELPIMSREEFENIGNALALIASQLSRLALQNILQAREITKRKRSETALRKSESQIRQLNEDLERRVSERTAELEEANHELESFSYSVSHDLRAPLRVIDGFSRILLEEYNSSLDEDALRYLKLVRDNTLRMGQLIDDLLTFSRLSRQPLKKRPFDLAQLIQQVIKEISVDLDISHVEFKIGALPACYGDANMMHQVLSNLISNAIKFTSQTKNGIIEIGYENKEGKPVVFIKDNGVGFNMAYSEKLFGVFQRLHRQEDFPGTGVGLAIVQRIIHRHGGQICAQGEEGKGATFYFTLNGAVGE